MLDKVNIPTGDISKGRPSFSDIGAIFTPVSVGKPESRYTHTRNYMGTGFQKTWERVTAPFRGKKAIAPLPLGRRRSEAPPNLSNLI